VTPEVDALLDALIRGARDALEGNLVGVYTRGSLALGDFDPDTSDVDVLVLMERAVSDAEFEALAGFHARLGGSANRYSQALEVAYLPRGTLERFSPGESHPALCRWYHMASTFERREYGIDWVLERWTIRERGTALVGPYPRELILPISPDELREAGWRRLQDWDAFAVDTANPEWLHRRHHAYVVETMCRALCTATTGEVVSKPAAVEWAASRLPPRWRPLLDRARAWRLDDAGDPSPQPDVLAFVHWAATTV
jgi:hypothetical protein